MATPVPPPRPITLEGFSRSIPRVGIDLHAMACYTLEGKLECVCGLSDREPIPDY